MDSVNLFTLRFKEGDQLPSLKESGIDHKVGPKGELLWRIRDKFVAWLEWTYEIRQYLWRKQEFVYTSIFRGLSALSKAGRGLHLPPLRYDGWPVQALHAPEQIVQEYEAAPHNVQAAVLRGAAQYLGLG